MTDGPEFAKQWDFKHMSSPRHPKANGKAKSTLKIVENLIKKETCAVKDLWLIILQWRNAPTKAMSSSPAQQVMSRRLRTPLLVADMLLELSVITDVPDRLRVKHQTGKLWYHRSAMDLPELKIGQDIKRKLLPSERMGGGEEESVCSWWVPD